MQHLISSSRAQVWHQPCDTDQWVTQTSLDASFSRPKLILPETSPLIVKPMTLLRLFDFDRLLFVLVPPPIVSNFQTFACLNEVAISDTSYRRSPTPEQTAHDPCPKSSLLIISYPPKITVNVTQWRNLTTQMWTPIRVLLSGLEAQM